MKCHVYSICKQMLVYYLEFRLQDKPGLKGHLGSVLQVSQLSTHSSFKLLDGDRKVDLLMHEPYLLVPFGVSLPVELYSLCIKINDTLSNNRNQWFSAIF